MRGLPLAVLVMVLVVALGQAGCGGAGGGTTGPGTDVAADVAPDGVAGDGTAGVDLPGEGTTGECRPNTEPQTTASMYSMFAGETVAITCAFPGCASWSGSGLDFQVAGQQGTDYTRTSRDITFRTPGQFEVGCAWTDLEGQVLVDQTPVSIEVKPGIPKWIETSISATEVSAGTRVLVTCTGEDDFGNPLAGPYTVEVTPGQGVAIGGMAITPLKSGTYKIACRLSDLYGDDTPETLKVNPGVPAKVVTTLSHKIIEAGETSGLSCEARDRYDNAIPMDALPVVVVLNPGLSLKGLAVTGTQAGLHEVKCVPAGLDWSLFQLFPATLEIIPGPPSKIHVQKVPDKPIYLVMENVGMKVTVRDGYENLIADPPLAAVTYEPGEGVVQSSAWVFRFLQEGNFVFTVALAAPHVLATEVTVVVDGTGPLLAVDRPVRGENVLGSTPVTLVEGTVVDDVTGLSFFQINGQSVTPAEDQSFAHNVSSLHGVNLLVVEAEDGAGGVTRTVRSYSHSSRWYPQTSANESWAGKAIEIFLPRSFVDDGDRNMAKPNDLATIITMYLATLDIGALIPNPVYNANNYKVYLKNVTVQTPEVFLQPQEGHLYLEAWFKNLKGKIDAIGSCYVLGVDLCPDAKGDLEVGSIHLEARIALSVDSNNEVKAEVTHLVLELREPSVKLQGLGVLLNPIIGALVSAFEEDAEAMLKQELAQVLPDLFKELFGQLALDEGIAIPSLIPGGPESLVQLQTRMAALNVTHKGIGLAMDARVRTQKKVTHNPLGSIGRGGCYGTDSGTFVLQQLEMQTAAGIHDDLLNQLLFGMWYGGSLNVTLTQAELGSVLGDLAGYGVQQPVIRLDFFSSPMFTACGTGDQLRFGIGDLYVEMDMLFLSVPVTIALYASVLGTGELSWVVDGAGGSIGIQLTSIDTLDYEFVSVTEGYEVLIDLFEELMQGDLLTGALDSLLGQGIQGFELPEIDLSGLLPGIPQGTKLKIVPASLQRRTGYTELLGTIDL